MEYCLKKRQIAIINRLVHFFCIDNKETNKFIFSEAFCTTTTTFDITQQLFLISQFIKFAIIWNAHCLNIMHVYMNKASIHSDDNQLFKVKRTSSKSKVHTGYYN